MFSPTNGLLILFGMLAACASREVQRSPAPKAGAVVVRNSIHIGLIETTFFVVDSVDGTRVHERLDFKRQVEVATGLREITVTHYTDALWGSREASETCTIALDAKPDGIYEIEGEAERGEWRARLVDRLTSEEFPCVFADEIPLATKLEDERQVEVVSPPPLAAAAGSGETKPIAAVAATTAGLASGRDGAEGVEEVALPARSPRRRSFCPSGFYRIAYFDGDTTFVLERSDRIRLIGVQADPTEAESPGRAGIRLEGKCVRFDYEPTNLIDGHRDRDGRLLAYVYLEDGTFVNVELIREGRFRATSQRHKHLAAFLAAQAEAREGSR